jgi:ATP/maltotriose-dependent transcriptional regulator MalT
MLQRQTPAVRAFLLRTAVLERLNAAPCEAVLGDPEKPAQETLTALEWTNLFLVPLDDERCWYRYHRLFHDFLRARLEMEHPDLVPTLHRRAARWYVEHDLTDEAIHHALAADDHGVAASHPDLTPEQRVELRGEVATIRTICAYPRGDMEATIEYAEQALAQLPQEEGVLRSMLALYLGNARSSRGEMEAASAAYEEAMQEGRHSGNLFVAFSAMLNLGNLWRLHGRWHDAAALNRDRPRPCPADTPLTLSEIGPVSTKENGL